ncbi:MAG: hypothetical protein ABFC71_09140 [Methanoregula sp.]|jgi:hypothetical protein
MGKEQDVMHGFVKQEISRFYSSFDGWTLLPVTHLKGYGQIFSAERFVHGEKESVLVLVSFEPTISTEVLKTIGTAGRGTYGEATTGGMAVIVPQNADLSGVAAGTRVLFMKSFSFADGLLVWDKNPVRKFVHGKAPHEAAASA